MSNMMSSSSRWYPLCVIALFLAVQLHAVDYGTKINDITHVKSYAVSGDMVTGSALERDQIVGSGAGESLDRWMMRFKLYSIEADEHVNVMALARIKPHEGRFDPHFYQYGGAWLYPLGAWYMALSNLGIITVSPLSTYLEKPDLMDGVYIGGRIFVLLSVACASLFLYATCRRFASTYDSLLCMSLFLAAPGTIMFSQVMKPHWYALVWVCATLFVLTRSASGLPWRGRDTLRMGACLGLAVGSVLTFGLFAALCWFALVVFVSRHQVPFHALVYVPVIAIIVYMATNPYVILNWETFASEASVVRNWFSKGSGPNALLSFVTNSLLANFGVGTVLLMFTVGIHKVVASPRSVTAWFILAVAGIVFFIAILTSSISTWHTNTRYIAYLLPLGLVFLCFTRWRNRTLVLSTVLALLVIQATPLALAYHDENNPLASTRFLAANWVSENVEQGAALCVGTKTVAPFDSPPIDFSRYAVNDPSCEYTVIIERSVDAVRNRPEGSLKHRLQPRFSFEPFPLVFSHINPQISIYQRAQTN